MLSSSKGRVPHSKAYRITPIDHTSTSAPAYRLPLITYQEEGWEGTVEGREGGRVTRRKEGREERKEAGREGWRQGGGDRKKGWRGWERGREEGRERLANKTCKIGQLYRKIGQSTLD